MNLLDRIMQTIRRSLMAEIAGITPDQPADTDAAEPTQRVINVDTLHRQIYEWIDTAMPGMYLAQLYIEDDGTLYALFSRDDRLFRAPITLSDGTIQIGELVEVQQEFTPISRSSVTLRELPNGDVRFFLVAATAVVNRVGEIDSTTLFDNMIRRAEELNFYPRLDAYHLGSLDPAFEFGEFDFLARDGVTYIASGVMQGDHPLTQACLRQYRTNPASLGASIEYYPLVGAFEDFEVGGATIRTFLDGINTRISILFEEDAASWFTSMRTGDLAMQQRQLDDATKAKLRKLFGEDEAAMDKFLGNIEGITRAVDDLGLIARGTDAGADTGEDDPEAEDNPTNTEIVIDDEAINQIAAAVVRQLGDGALKTVNDQIAELTKTVNALTADNKKLRSDLSAATSAQRSIVERLDVVEADDDTKRTQWLGDLPRNQRTVTVTHRPRSVERAADPVAETSDDVANATLAAMPDPTKRRK